MGLPLKTNQKFLNGPENHGMDSDRHVLVCQCTMLHELHWLPVCFWVWFKMLVIIYKALCGMRSDYLRDHLSPVVFAWQIQSCRVDTVQVPSVKQSHLSECQKHAISVVVPLWNEIPCEMPHSAVVQKSCEDLPLHPGLRWGQMRLLASFPFVLQFFLSFFPLLICFIYNVSY